MVLNPHGPKEYLYLQISYHFLGSYNMSPHAVCSEVYFTLNFFSNTSLPPYNKLDEATESMAVVDTD